jgi:hypothetical protein
LGGTLVQTGIAYGESGIGNGEAFSEAYDPRTGLFGANALPLTPAAGDQVDGWEYSGGGASNGGQYWDTGLEDVTTSTILPASQYLFGGSGNPFLPDPLDQSSIETIVERPGGAAIENFGTANLDGTYGQGTSWSGYIQNAPSGWAIPINLENNARTQQLDSTGGLTNPWGGFLETWQQCGP